MQFGIKKGSSKEITLDDIKNYIDTELKISVPTKPQNNTEIFIEACYDLAKEKDMTAVIHLDHVFIVDDEMNLKSNQLLAVKFTKNKH
jgi:hypothetical protein